MGNIYGVANALPKPAAYAPVAGDIVCNAGAETTVITTGAIAANNPGDYYPMITGVLTILLGGVAPGALVIGARIGAGADFDTYTVEPALLIASAELVIPVCLVGANSATAWIGSGSTINITVNATAQNVTCKTVGSKAIVALFRGPDL